jgi:hypothetical protein
MGRLADEVGRAAGVVLAALAALAALATETEAFLFAAFEFCCFFALFFFAGGEGSGGGSFLAPFLARARLDRLTFILSLCAEESRTNEESTEITEEFEDDGDEGISKQSTGGGAKTFRMKAPRDSACGEDAGDVETIGRFLFSLSPGLLKTSISDAADEACDDNEDGRSTCDKYQAGGLKIFSIYSPMEPRNEEADDEDDEAGKMSGFIVL